MYAWIESPFKIGFKIIYSVATYMYAWIESFGFIERKLSSMVATYMYAWIERRVAGYLMAVIWCRNSCVCVD